MVKLIMLICFAPLLPIMYAMLRNEATFKKNISLGVTLPYEARTDEYVLAVCGRYKKQLTMLCVALFLLQIPFYLIASFGFFMLAYMIWLMFVIALPYIPFLRGHKDLKAYKEEKGWLRSSAGSMVVDLKTAAEERRSLSGWWFALPVAISLLPLAIEGAKGSIDAWPTVLVNLIVTATVASFYLFYRIINRQRGDIVDENPTLNQALTRIRRYNWSKMWLWMAWLTGLFNVCLWYLAGDGAAFMVIMILYIALILFVVLRTEFAARKAQYRLTVESGKGSYIDEDQFWPYGIFYYNPGDKHLMVNQRTGIGATVNMGRPAGKVLIVISALIVALLPMTGVWMILDETAPLSIAVTADEVVATHTGSYHVSLGDIQSAQLLDAMPTGAVRIMGTGLDNLAKGRFRVPEIGDCQLSLDPTAPPYLLLYTDQDTYLFGSRNPEETLAVYERVQLETGLG